MPGNNLAKRLTRTTCGTVAVAVLLLWGMAEAHAQVARIGAGPFIDP